MFIAMNHFRVAAGRGSEFERIWRDRESYLGDVPGFVQFHLVRGKDREDGTYRYASHVIWDSHKTFLDWTHSEAFRKAHGVVGSLVAEAQKSGRSLRETAASELAALSPTVAKRLDELFDPEQAVRAKSLPGGTAPDAVRASLDAAVEALEPA